MNSLKRIMVSTYFYHSPTYSVVGVTKKTSDMQSSSSHQPSLRRKRYAV